MQRIVCSVRYGNRKAQSVIKTYLRMHEMNISHSIKWNQGGLPQMMIHHPIDTRARFYQIINQHSFGDVRHKF